MRLMIILPVVRIERYMIEETRFSESWGYEEDKNTKQYQAQTMK